MAFYNNGFPATYQNPWQQGYYQPVQQPVQPPVQQAVPQQSIIWISGEREAQMYPVAPNNAVTLWSQTEPVVYLKQADASGKPSMKIFDLVERSQSVSETGGKVSAYATKSELEKFNSALDDLRADVDKIRSEYAKIRKPQREVEEE